MPALVSVEASIDYAAGRSAKEQLMKKLECVLSDPQRRRMHHAAEHNVRLADYPPSER